MVIESQFLVGSGHQCIIGPVGRTAFPRIYSPIQTTHSCLVDRLLPRILDIVRLYPVRRLSSITHGHLDILCEGRRIPEGSERLIDFAFFGPCKAHSERCGLRRVKMPVLEIGFYILHRRLARSDRNDPNTSFDGIRPDDV